VSAEGHGTRAIVAAFFANLGIAVAKFVAFVFSGSSSMLAESIHSVADTGNQGLLMLGGRLAKREATDDFQFGFGRERYFWAFVVSLVLFSLGSLFALFEGFEKIAHAGHELESVGWAFGVLGIAIVLEGYSLRTAVLEAGPLRGTGTWWQFVRTAKVPELPIVLLEDLGALIGLALAGAALVIAVITGDAVWDGIGTVCIGVLLGAIASVLAVEMRRLLIGESASKPDQEAIVAAVLGTPGVLRLIHLRTQHIGPSELLVGIKVALEPGFDMRRVAETINDLERRVRDGVRPDAVIYVEPDLYSGTIDEP
jgi:cation diffusion facilitator family transporter